MRRYTVSEGIVIRRKSLPSGDLVVTLLGEGGKWRAIARKGRLPGGNAGRLSLFHDVTVQYYRKHDDDLALLTQVQLNGALPHLSDPAIYPYAHLLAELVDALTVDVHLGERLHAHLTSGLRGLNSHADPEHVALLYAWRILAVAGLAPRTDACVVCGTEATLTALEVAMGGLACGRHGSGIAIGEAVAAELTELVSAPARDALARPPHDRAQHWHLLGRYLSYHVSELQSLELLQRHLTPTAAQRGDRAA